MIKISIDEISKKEIEKNFWEDANSNTTGLIQVLNTTNAIIPETYIRSKHSHTWKR